VVSTSYNFTTIDFPSATSTFLYGISNNGQVVGAQRDANGLNPLRHFGIVKGSAAGRSATR